MLPEPSATETETETTPQALSSASLKQPGRARRLFFSLVRILFLVYGGTAIIFFAFQTRLIFPGAATQGSPEAIVHPPPDVELVPLTTGRGDKIVALFGPALQADGSPHPDAAACPTMLYFYGNAMCLQAAADQLTMFRSLGCNVMIPEYVGYGMSAGRAGEAGCRETADAALVYLATRRGVDRGKIIAAGWSLGGAVALDLAARQPVAGVATFCTFTSMGEMAQTVVPFLPSSLLLMHRFENLAKIPQVGCPVLIGHGRADPLIPFAMADRLAAAAQGPVTRITIDEAGHNDFFTTGWDRIEIPFRQFIAQLPRR